MVQIPDNVRPYIDFVVKQHFWLLMPLVPLLVLPLLFMAKGSLGEQIVAARGQIDSRLSALRSVEGIKPHPNEAWSAQINARTNAVRRQTRDEWRRFWESQQPLRVWPAALGDDFVQRAAALKPDGKLPRKLLERYQNSVRALVRQLPARMGADEVMVDPVAPVAGPGGPQAQPAQAVRSNKLVVWSPEDQKRVYASFDWEKPPSTMQVVLAQEELWVYGLLCDSIARVNKVAAGPYNSPIPLVQQLAIGYAAAEDDPGGSRGGRILVSAAPAAGGMPMGEDGAPPAMDGAGPAPAAPRPPHPRFGGGGGQGPGGAAPPPPPPEEGGAAPAASPDDPLKNWIYVDFNGKPLSAQELAASPDATMVHLMPFAIRAVIDERHLDAWLVDLARSAVPIDVRQVRINAGAAGSQPQPGAAMPELGPVGQSPVATTGRRHDVVVELRGTVALATPPDEKLLGIEPEPQAEPALPAERPEAGEPAEPAPSVEQPEPAPQPPAEAAPVEAVPAEPAPAESAPADVAPAETEPAPPLEPAPPDGEDPQPEQPAPAVQEPAA